MRSARKVGLQRMAIISRARARRDKYSLRRLGIATDGRRIAGLAMIAPAYAIVTSSIPRAVPDRLLTEASIDPDTLLVRSAGTWLTERRAVQGQARRRTFEFQQMLAVTTTVEHRVQRWHANLDRAVAAPVNADAHGRGLRRTGDQIQLGRRKAHANPST